MIVSQSRVHDSRDCFHCNLILNQKINNVFEEIKGISFEIIPTYWPHTELGRHYKFGLNELRPLPRDWMLYAPAINSAEHNSGLPVKLWRIAGNLGFVTAQDRKHAQSLLRTLGKYHGTEYRDTAADIALQFSIEKLQ